MNAKSLKLTEKQMDVLRRMASVQPGTWLTTRQIATPLSVKDYFIRLGFGSKVLRPLQERGFILGRRQDVTGYAEWSLGPMSDALREQGLL